MKRLRRAGLGAPDRASREGGASMVEYAILVAVIAGVVFAAATFMGGQISTLMAGVNLHT
ncbi:Flp family type IVb pilin [Aeromicrobium ginsengisoli]|uniref:Flp family type IVb pilin n=2 Tax=Aeromicrobium ginsengisoli TaxID=363867 RepID=A0A5M4FJW1_9ACTN|nr:Flp family type IVb pilin [Aeromicrobium ginsengisoli]